MQGNIEYVTVFEMQGSLKLAYEIDLVTGKKSYFVVASWLLFVLNLIFIGIEIVDRFLKLLYWVKYCWETKKFDRQDDVTNAYTGIERVSRNVCTQTSGHYAWKSTRPCVTDLKNDRSHSVWEILDLEGREHSLRVNQDERGWGSECLTPMMMKSHCDSARGGRGKGAGTN